MDTYTIVVKGHIDGRSAHWFEGMRTLPLATGETELCGPVVDQAALHGLLSRIRDLGLPLLAVIYHAPDAAHIDPDRN